MNRWIAYLLILFLFSCTTNIMVDNLPSPENKIVVEGYIEQGKAPYVLLTKNTPYFGGFNLNDIDKYLVHDALVTVSDGVTEEILDEQCVTVTRDSVDYTVCIYAATNPTLFGEIHKSYKLKVEAEGYSLSATTYIPDLLKFNSLYYEPHDNPDADSLVSLLASYTDPDTLGNYFRYYSKRNSEPMYPVVASDDRFFNGQTFDLPLRRGQDPDAKIDLNTYGYFWKGDTVVVKWASISKETYDFWNTVDADASGGPLGTATVVKTNIEGGGLGIWGGYAVYYDTLYIPE